MPDSMNARRGDAMKDTKQKYVAEVAAKMKLTNIEFRNLKKSIKDKLCHKENLVTSEYFEYFDNIDPQNINGRHQYFLRYAANIAINSDMNHKHGAVIVHKKNVIAHGYNYFDYKNLVSVHAEVAALTNIKGRNNDILKDCKMYVVRIGSDKLNEHFKYSKPCTNCQNYISKKCIKKTYYSTNYEYDKTIAKYLYLRRIGFDKENQCKNCVIIS